MLVCPVALFADVLLWLAHAGMALLMRMTSAVALAATAFSVAVLVTEKADAIRGAFDNRGAILSEVIAQPALTATRSEPIRVAAVNN